MSIKNHKKGLWLFVLAVLVCVTGVFFYSGFRAKGSVYGWLQTDWSGGADTSATSTHASDQTGWDKYYSKNASVVASTTGELSLASTTASLYHTETADFSGGTLSAVFATSGAVSLAKPLGVACTGNNECASAWCSISGYCGDCSGMTYGSTTHETVIINNQCWLASNLNIGNYVASVNTGSDHSDVSNNGIIEKYCYNNTLSNCDTYGGLYDWNEMMGYVTTAGAQGICPSGWHIPTDSEWYALENYLKDEGETCNASRSGTYDCVSAGTKLKSGGSSDFSGLLAGFRYSTGGFGSLSSNAFFWSSFVSGAYAWRRYLSSSEAGVYRFTGYQTYGFSVRCLKD